MFIYHRVLSTIPIICHGYLHHDLPVQKANLHENWAKLGLPSPAEGGVLLGQAFERNDSDHGENTKKWLANGSSPNMDKYGFV